MALKPEKNPRFPSSVHRDKRVKITDPATDDPTKKSIQVIERMLSLLDALADSPKSVSLKLLAERTGLHSSTAYRILATMTRARIVERCRDGGYRLGIRLLELGSIVKGRLDIREIALPLMRRLSESIGEAVNLGIRHGDEIVYIERASSADSLVRVVYLLGGRAPLHLTSVGKLFLAAESAIEVEAYARRTGLPGKTPHSLTTLLALDKELARVRRHEIAFDNEEAELGLKCLAVPIYDDEGHLLAGLSVSSPAERHNSNWVDPVRKTAVAISQALGYVRRD